MKLLKKFLWAVAAIPFGILAGGFCGVLAGGLLADLFGVTDPMTGTRHPAEWWLFSSVYVGAAIGAIYCAVLWGRNQGPLGR
jgi:hypothetical protein